MLTNSLAARIAAVAAFLIPLAVARAGDITVISPINSVVPDGAGPGDFTFTAFPEIPLGGKFVTYFAIRNTGTVTRHITGPVTAGASPGFSIEQQPNMTTLLPNAITYVYVQFLPTSPGFDSSTIAIPTDAPGSLSSYAFTCTGVGVSTPSTLPDLGISATLKKLKTDKKTGNLTAYGQLQLSNSGHLAVTTAQVDIYYSDTPWLDITNSIPQLTYIIKNLPLPSEKTGEPKLRKKNFKLPTGTTQPQYIFLAAKPLDPPVTDRYYGSNLFSLSLLPD